MFFTKKVQLAIRIIQATKSDTAKVAPVPLWEIAKEHEVSRAFLEQIAGPLRQRGVIASRRGPGGGYVYAWPNDTLSVRELFDILGQDTGKVADDLPWLNSYVNQVLDQPAVQ